MQLDHLTLVLLACLGIVVFHVVRKIWRNRAANDEDAWEGVPYEQRLRNLFDCTPLGYQEVDTEGVIRLVNRRECEIRGLEASDLLGKHIWELAGEPDRKKVRESYFEMLASKKTQPTTRRIYVRPDGRSLTLEVYATPLRNGEGNVLGMSIASLDITDRQRNEEKAFQATSELKALFQAFPDIFLRVDDKGTVVDCKASKSAISGLLDKEPVGKPLGEIIPRAGAGKIQMELGGVLKNGSPSVVEYEMVRHAKRDYYEARILPLDWNEAIVILRNITANRHDATRLREYAQELEQKNRDLEEALLKAKEATKLKSRFLANMSHEIRTPMNGVIGMTDFLLATSLDSEQQEYAESVKNSANSLLTILNDVLDVSKIEAGKLQVETIPFDLENTLEEVANVFSLRARSRELSFRYTPPPHLNCLVRGDPGRLRQVLNNLLGNAIKFTEKGEISLRGELVRQTPERVTLRFTVEDTGIGIASEQQKSLFESFTQGDDSMTRKYGGTGLGLAISKQLVELMGGQIGVRSKPGEGSSFWFTLTYGKQTRLTSISSTGAPDLAGLRVLILDHNNSSAQTIKRHLASWGCKTVLVNDADRVLPVLRDAVAEGRPFGIALIDLGLSELDGHPVDRAIRSDTKLSGTQLVAMTSAPMRGDGLRVHQSGYAGYLVKPVQPDELRDMLIDVLKSKNRPGAPLVTRHTTKHDKTRVANAARALSSSVTNKRKRPETPPVEEPAPQPGKKLRALVAEDNLVNQKVAARLLQKSGLEVDVVSNGREAVEASERAPYALILMDCQMPVMDGFEATEIIRRREGNGRHTPICALTAHAMKADRAKCLKAGMDDYLSKPVDLERLRETVHRLLRQDQVAK